MSTQEMRPPVPPQSSEPIAELAPSVLREDEPTLARYVGAIGLVSVTLGSSALLASLKWTTIIPPPVAALFFALGMASLLYHAAADSDLQLRRVYAAFGLAWLLLGVLFALVPYKGVTGGLFLPYGMTGGLLGLLFCLAATRQETDEAWYNGVALTLCCVGALAALAGFIGSNLSLEFLMPRGFVFMLFGLAFLWAFVGMKSADDALGYRIGLLLGAVGLLALAVAIVRSIMNHQYMMPGGLLLGGLGLAYLAIALGICSDSSIVVIARREIASYFYSPIAYILFVGIVFVGWLRFGEFFVEMLWDRNGPGQLPEPIVSFYFLQMVPVICVTFLVPALTMRLLSEENRSGTIEVLLTAPVHDGQVVLGKFLASWLFLFLLWIPWGLYLVALRYEGGQPFDYRPLVAFYVGSGVAFASFVAMGLFFSSLTRNQIVAAVLTFAVMLVLLVLYLVKMSLLQRGYMTENDLTVVLMTRTSYIDLWFNASQGKMFARDLVLQLSLAAFWLFATVKVLESRKWR